MDDLDAERMIEEIKKNPAIWDWSTEEYKDKSLKKVKWIAVCRAVKADYEELDTQDRMTVCKELQEKWKNIRDCYVRYLRVRRNRSGQSRRGMKKYVYARHLDFLNPITTSRNYEHSRTPEVVDKGEDVEHESDGGVSCVVAKVDVKSSEEEPKKRGKKKRKKLEQNTEVVENGKNEDEETEVETNRTYGTRRRKTPERETEFYQREKIPRNEEPNCDDMDFFRSLLPLIKPMSLHQRMNFRMDVMKLALEHSEKSRAPMMMVPTTYATQQFQHHNRVVASPAGGSTQSDAISIKSDRSEEILNVQDFPQC